MTEEKLKENEKFNVSINPNETLEIGVDNAHNIGYFLLSKIYHSLEIDTLFSKLKRRRDFKVETR